MNPNPSFTHPGRRRRLLILPGLCLALAGASLAADTDADGLDDSVETNTGIFVSATNTGTNPNVGDSDSDGVPDGVEVKEKTSPVNATQFNAFSKGLAAYYPLNGSGTDWTGSSLDGALNNASWSIVDGQMVLETKAGSPSGLVISGGGSRALPASGWSISGWVKCKDFSSATAPNGYYTLYETGDLTSLQQSSINLGYSGHGLNVQITGLDDYPTNASYYQEKFYRTNDFTSDTLRPGQWHHICVVVSGQTVSAFVDGALLKSSGRGASTWTGQAPKVTNRPAGIGLTGNISGSLGSNSSIKNVRIYRRPLNVGEVATLSQTERPQFQIVQGSYTWQQAKADAEARGGRLAVLNTQEKILNSLQITSNPILAGSYHIGLQDPLLSGQWKWIDGSALSASHWASGEPQNYQGRGETVVAMIPTYGGKWADIRIDDVYDGYLLESTTTKTLTINSPTNGAITGAGSYTPGTSATLTATPSIGYVFSGWTGDVSGTTNPLTLTMDADKTVGANFSKNLTDADGDGVTAHDELVTYQTDPTKADSDADGVPDGLEVKEGTSPLDATKFNAFSKGLIGYWPLDGDAKDLSGKGNHAVEANINYKEDRFGQSSTAAKFGANSSLEIASLSTVAYRPITYSMWFKIDQLPASGKQMVLIGRIRTWDQACGAIVIDNALGTNNQIGYFSGGAFVSSGFKPNVNQWHHISVTLESTGSIIFYADGQLVSSKQFDAQQSTDFPFRIGAASVLNGIDGNNTYSLLGLVDNVRLYSSVLTGPQLSALYQSERPQFQIIPGSFTWQQAKADAEARGGRLAVLNTQQKITAANQVIATSQSPATWIGLTDEVVEGQWKWITGETLTTSQWDAGEPNNLGNEDYAMIRANGFWSDASSPGPIGYLLESTTSKTLTITSPTNGAVTGAGSYSPGASATLTATPSLGYVFSGWTGDASGTTNPLTLTMDADKTVGASFSKNLTDADGDGVTAYDELVTYQTDPTKADSDGDGLTDGWEIGVGRFSLVGGTTARTWLQARNDAKTRGGDLASFPTQDSWDRMLASVGVSALDAVVGAWIGASDVDVDGDWRWVNGRPFSFSQWGTARPTTTVGNTLDYLEVSGGDGAEPWKWFDRSLLTTRTHYILEMGYSTDPRDGDSDDDGLTDGAEATAGSNPFLTDSDGDGLSDTQEVQLTGTHPGKADTDNDGTPDGTDDQDGDTLGNLAEIATHGTDPKVADTDGDGLSDGVEVSINRGFFKVITGSFTQAQAAADAASRRGRLAALPQDSEFVEVMVRARQVTEAYLWLGLSDEAAEGVWKWSDGSTLQLDRWLSGQPNGGASENHALVMEKSQRLADGAAAFVAGGYVFERRGLDPRVADTDGDGLSDGAEQNVHLTDPFDPDSDNDTLSDGDELSIHKSNPKSTDTDNDGLSDRDEVVLHKSNPSKADTDNDGFDDLFEVRTGFSPLLATSTPDAISSIRTAVEFRFNAAAGVSYRIEGSTDLKTWAPVEASINGTGGVVTRFYSTENQPQRYFRVRRN